ncbi:MAG: hypothetical protein EBT03_05920 [Betaproteobacteria bacterium]|nr:hypothetical protein [Betaproteobacteria bacterium]NBT75975.1 hypothetical protein [Betaproteobacteria bacterium]NBY14426.1 hypothetical protein [Betaproteobacteria bacterium]NCA16730.1 hypothetical protein [Betaproteobacteria bacterium]NDF03779.1 hypothetical protein [Betaproteobacteria bacterium]
MSKAWSVLLQLAEQQVEQAQISLVQIDAAIARIQRRQEQVRALIAENEARRRGQGGSQTMAQMQVVTQFLVNLSKVLPALENELAGLRHQRAATVEFLARARREEKRMQALVERDAARLSKEKAERDQREMDAAGIGLFNRRKVAALGS